MPLRQQGEPCQRRTARRLIDTLWCNVSSHTRDLIIRADAGARIGAGHVMRCIALGQAWRDSGGRVTFVTACQSEGLLRRLQKEEFYIQTLPAMHPHDDDWEKTEGILSQFKSSWVVLDGYHFDTPYEQRIKDIGNKLLVIGSMTYPRTHYADIVLNASLNAEEIGCSCAPHTRLLLGPRYLLVRQEFLVWRGWARRFPDPARHLLVTLGGSAPQSAILKVIRAVHKAAIAGLDTTLVLGPANNDTQALEALLRQGSLPVRIIHSPPDMATLMAEADLAITGGGTTSWETSFMGLPMLVIVIAENQENTARTMQQAGIADSLGWHEDVSDETIARRIKALVQSKSARDEMSQAQRKLVDGLGAGRVVAELNRIQVS